MTNEQKKEWQRMVAQAIITPDQVSAAEKLQLLTEWPLLREWAKYALKRDPNKVLPKALNAYMRDALAWSGHLGDPADILSSAPESAATAPSSRASSEGNKKQQRGKAKGNTTADAEHDASPSDLSSEGDASHATHFDQYRHLLPKEIQQRFDEEISDLYLLRTELANRRDQLADVVQQAMYAGEERTEDEAAAKLADVAKQLVNADATIRSFWALVDVAYDYYQRNGRVMPIEDLREQTSIEPRVSAKKKTLKTPLRREK